MRRHTQSCTCLTHCKDGCCRQHMLQHKSRSGGIVLLTEGPVCSMLGIPSQRGHHFYCCNSAMPVMQQGCQLSNPSCFSRARVLITCFVRAAMSAQILPQQRYYPSGCTSDGRCRARRRCPIWSHRRWLIQSPWAMADVKPVGDGRCKARRRWPIWSRRRWPM